MGLHANKWDFMQKKFKTWKTGTPQGAVEQMMG